MPAALHRQRRGGCKAHALAGVAQSPQPPAAAEHLDRPEDRALVGERHLADAAKRLNGMVLPSWARHVPSAVLIAAARENMGSTGSFWLVKSEPAKYAFSDLERDGRTVWDGVRNNQAALHLKAMKLGDQVLYYHSQEGLAVVGIAEVVREAFIDPTDPAGRFVAVELAPVRSLPRPVSLAEMKA